MAAAGRADTHCTFAAWHHITHGRLTHPCACGCTPADHTIIYSRADYYHLCDHPFLDVGSGGQRHNAASRAIFVPEGEDYTGVCDRHRVFHSADAKAALDWMSWVVSSVAHIHANLTSEEALHHTLRLARSRNQSGRLRRFQRTMFLGALRNDSTRWSVARTPVPKVDGLFLKYPSEYRLAAFTCNAMQIPAGTQAFFLPPGTPSGRVSQSEPTMSPRAADAPALKWTAKHGRKRLQSDLTAVQHEKRELHNKWETEKALLMAKTGALSGRKHLQSNLTAVQRQKGRLSSRWRTSNDRLTAEIDAIRKALAAAQRD
jgi:hypothetical protein